MRKVNAFTMGLFVAVIGCTLSATSVNAGLSQCGEAQGQKAEPAREKTSSGKWNAAGQGTVDQEYVKQLIAAHQLYVNGFTPLLPKFAEQ